MNYLFLIVTTLFSFSNFHGESNNDENQIKKNLIKVIKENIGDPSSFELVDFYIIDTVYYIDNVNYRREYFERDLNRYKDDLNRNENYKTSIPSMYSERKSEDLKKEIAKQELILNKIDSIADGLGETINDIASYTGVVKFRSKNEYNAKVLSEYYIQTSPPPELRITNMTTERSKLYNNPNDFPGYREMMIKNL